MDWLAAIERLRRRWFVRRVRAAAGTQSVAAQAPAHRPAIVGGRYRLDRQLGRGALGTVYLAIDTVARREVAVKLMHRTGSTAKGGPAVDDDTSAREQRAAARLSHPGIVALLDAGGDDHTAWVVSEYAPGVSLARYTQPARRLPEPLVLRVGAQLADALAHAHAHGVVHRDLKPSNVLLELSTGVARLLDFGVARVDDGFRTRTGMTLGTPSYMAPEQLAGAPASAATDTYALGVMLFELLAGRRPHDAATLGELLRAVGSGEAARLQPLCPQLDASAVDAVESLLRRDPARRPADLRAFALQLAGCADRATMASAPRP